VSNVYESAWWCVELPQGWLGDEDEGCVTFVNVDGAGALQISAYGKSDKEVADEDSENFSQDDRKRNPSTKKVSYGQFVGIGICERTVTRYWRKYWLRAGSVLLFVTYNCKLDDEGIEEREVDRILHSLTLNESVSRCEGLLN
jgi:hypothetical protein